MLKRMAKKNYPQNLLSEACSLRELLYNPVHLYNYNIVYRRGGHYLFDITQYLF